MPDDAVSEFILLRIPKGEEDAIRADNRFLHAFHMNKRTWFAIQLDGGVGFAEILRLTECSRTLALPAHLRVEYLDHPGRGALQPDLLGRQLQRA